MSHIDWVVLQTIATMFGALVGLLLVAWVLRRR